MIHQHSQKQIFFSKAIVLGLLCGSFLTHLPFAEAGKTIVIDGSSELSAGYSNTAYVGVDGSVEDIGDGIESITANNNSKNNIYGMEITNNRSISISSLIDGISLTTKPSLQRMVLGISLKSGNNSIEQISKIKVTNSSRGLTIGVHVTDGVNSISFAGKSSYVSATKVNKAIGEVTGICATGGTTTITNLESIIVSADSTSANPYAIHSAGGSLSVSGVSSIERLQINNKVWIEGNGKVTLKDSIVNSDVSITKRTVTDGSGASTIVSGGILKFEGENEVNGNVTLQSGRIDVFNGAQVGITGDVNIDGFAGDCGMEARAGGGIAINSGLTTGKTTMSVTSGIEEGKYIYGLVNTRKGENNTTLVVGGESLDIDATSSGGHFVAIHVSTNSKGNKQNKKSVTTINAGTTTIDITDGSNYTGAALEAMSEGILNIESDLTIHAADVVVARGGAEININTDGEHTTNITGDVNFNFHQGSSGDPVNAQVNINLTGASSWTGNSLISWDNKSGKPGGTLMDVDDFAVVIDGEEAQWTPTYVTETETKAASGQLYTKVNTLQLDNGGKVDINLEGENIPQVQVGQLTGSKGNVTMETGTVLEIDVSTNDDLSITGGTLRYTEASNAQVLAGDKLTLNGTTVEQQLTVYGTLDFTDCNFIGGVVYGGALSTVSGSVELDNLTITESSDPDEVAILNVGTDDSAGVISADDLNLNGNVLVLDPEWQEGVGIEGASLVAAAMKNNNALDGTILVGRNSVLTLGSKDKTIAFEVFNTAVAKGNLTSPWGKDGISGAAYIVNSIDVGGGALLVDGAKTALEEIPATGTLNFAAGSLLMVKADEFLKDFGKVAITGVAAVSVDEDATLYLQDAKLGKTYCILAGDTGQLTEKNTWTREQIRIRDVYQGIVQTNGYNYNVTIGVAPAAVRDTVAPEAFLSMGADLESSAFAYMDAVLQGESALLRNKEMNHTANLPEELGVLHNHFSVNNINEEALAKHLALNEYSQGREVWAEAIHSKENIRGLGLKSQGNNYDTQYNGAIVGVDLLDNGQTTVGAAMTYIDGKAAMAGNYNEGKYYGGAIYGRTKTGKDTGLIYDVSYIHSSNDLEMNSGYGKITGEQRVNSFSVGTRLEQELLAGHSSSFLPYIGIRWLRMKGDSFTNNLGNSYNPDATNSFLVPLGLSFKVSMESEGWKMSFLAEGGYQWNAGDREYTQHFSYNGQGNNFVGAFIDRSSWYGGLGLEFAKNNFTVNFGYRYAKSEGSRQDRCSLSLHLNF